MLNKILSSEETVKLIKDGDTVAIAEFVGNGHPKELTLELEKGLLKEGKPENLTIVGAAGKPNPEIGLTCNVGGSSASAVVTILERR